MGILSNLFNRPQAATPPEYKPRGYRREISQIVKDFTDLRNDYNAAKASAYRRKRKGTLSTGSSADYHYRSEADFLRLIEQARDMARNDPAINPLLDRLTQNTIQDGLRLDSQSGDEILDKELEARFEVWGGDADACDISQRHTLETQAKLAFRSMHVDGDIITIGTDTGALELIEAHRLRTPNNAKAPEGHRFVHGILLNQTQQAIKYWITKADTHNGSIQASGFVPHDARDADGYRQIFHLYRPHRISQTRGVTSFAPFFDFLNMFEDINFAKLVQQQVVSAFAIFIQREASQGPNIGGLQVGAQATEPQSDGSSRIVESLHSGLMIEGQPGESMHGFSPNIPNPEFFPHVKMILQLVSVNLGLPLVLVLLDASETNFSGWRGAVDQARMGFRDNQTTLIEKFYQPIYLWKLRQWIAEDAAIRNASKKAKINIFSHRWNRPTWPYIEPYKDAQADNLRLTKNLISPRRLFAERGREWNEVLEEIVEDNALLVERAIKRAQQITEQYPDAKINWCDLVNKETKQAPPGGGGNNA